MQRTLIYLGLALVAVGVLWPVFGKLKLGRLPGDIVIRGENSTVYIPIVTMLLLSAVLTLVFWFLRRR